MVMTKEKCYVLYDLQMNTFRRETTTGDEGIIFLADKLIEYTESDAEPYISENSTVSDSMVFLELYGYQLVEISETELEHFKWLICSPETDDNRLSLKHSEAFRQLIAYKF